MIMTHERTRGGDTKTLPGTVNLFPESGTYDIQCSQDQAELLEVLERNDTDFVVIGAVLPARSGAEFCRSLSVRDGHMQYPVMLLRAAAPSGNGERLLTDDRQATHAPCSRLEPVAVPDEESTPVTPLKDLVIHPGRHEVRVKDRIVDLTATEFRLLGLLTEQPGWVLTRDQIIEGIRGKGYACTPRSVDVLIVGLRRKLGPIGKRIQTVRGVGYRYRE